MYDDVTLGSLEMCARLATLQRGLGRAGMPPPFGSWPRRPVAFLPGLRSFPFHARSFMARVFI